jgi:hypothetical protein
MSQVSTADDPSSMFALTPVIPAAGGALVGWTEIDSSVAFHVRSMNFDGSAGGPDQEYLPAPTPGGLFSLAGNGCGFAGIVFDMSDECSFIPLDADGTSAGPVVTVPSGGACMNLGPLPNGFSFVSFGQTNSLVSLSQDGAMTASAPLPATPMGYQERAFLNDDSFFFFWVGPSGEGELQGFSASGNALAPVQTLTPHAEAEPVAVQTPDGVLAVFSGDAPNGPGQTLFLRPLSVDGVPSAPATPIASMTDGLLETYAVASAPNGDALVTWFVSMSSGVQLGTQAFAPDGTPRGPATSVPMPAEYTDMRVLVSPGGDRALLILTASYQGGTVEALPLTCNQ